MALLEWSERYAIGDPAVDHEHRALVDLVNTLHAGLLAGGPRRDVEAFLGDLHRGIAAHFALEETLMRAKGYDQYAQHKADHERLLDDIREIMEDSRDAAAASAELAARLDAWFTIHFATHDARLHGRLGGHHGDWPGRGP